MFKNPFSVITMIATLFVASISEAQTNYNDVLVVINTNSPISDSIGTYFAQARSIPEVNIARIAVPTSEEIDSTQFNDLRTQLENYITTHNLQNQINYIVTTKGMPLKVNRGNTYSTSSPSSSVESELTLILGSYSSSIGRNGSVISPYYYQNAPFSRSTYGIYLVTRLDGYTFNDVKDMIDRSGPNTYVSPTSLFVFDQDPDWNNSLPGLNNALSYANYLMTQRGLTSILDNTTVYKTEQTNVIGYASWGSNDHYAHLYTEHAKPRNTWVPGSLVETYVSTSGRTLTSPPSYGQSLIADIIAEGATGAKGYVYEPFSSAMAIVWVLFDRYTNGYNLAESYYMASRALSWMDVVIGDPKTTITFTQPLPITLGFFEAQLVGSTVQLNWMTVSEINNYGFFVERRAESEEQFTTVSDLIPGAGTTIEPQYYEFVDSMPPLGTIYYRLKQIDLDGTVHYHEPVQVVNSPIMSTGNDYTIVNEFRLNQNFPNPFNPTTNISFSIPRTGRASLKVYNSLGQEVASLVDEEISAGTHSFAFHAGNLASGASSKGGYASGVYYYQLRADNYAATQKMLLVK